jgi:immune inhibitor A
MHQKSSSFPLILTIALVVVLCCLCLFLVLFTGGTAWLTLQRTSPEIPPVVIEQPLPNIILPTVTATPQQSIAATPLPPSVSLTDTLDTLNEAVVPINDPIELAERLGGKGQIPRTFPDPNAPYQVGDSKSFWVTNVDTRVNFQVTATVRYLGEHTYFWIENGVSYEPADLVVLGDTFDQEIYPTTRAFFGSEWSPGVDHDPRIHILYAGGLGASLAGYYSSADQLHPDAHEYSNAHEIFLINADNVRLWHSSIYSTLAHELQHMIHWHIDKNEETWLNEGFSMLAEIVNGYNPGGFDRLYIQNTDLQLTDWGATIGQNGPHYGAAMLFTTYFYDRFGKEVTQALVAEQKNGHGKHRRRFGRPRHARSTHQPDTHC